MGMNNVTDSDIRKAEDELAKLKAAKASQDGHTDIQKVAVLLREAFPPRDEDSWYYEMENGVHMWDRVCHRYWLEKAIAVDESFSLEEVKTFIKAIKR